VTSKRAALSLAHPSLGAGAILWTLEGGAGRVKETGTKEKGDPAYISSSYPFVKGFRKSGKLFEIQFEIFYGG
jgi:hypothetical protein